jgi:hypothetical protein
MKTIAALLLLTATAATAQQTSPAPQQADGHRRVLAQNRYYAKPGQAAAVLATRLEASAIRKTLGLPAGAVFLAQGDPGEGPTVVWECEFPTVEAREADRARAEAAPAFAAVQRRMRDLTVKVERLSWEAISPSGTP